MAELTTIEKLKGLRDKIKVAFAEFDTPAPAAITEPIKAEVTDPVAACTECLAACQACIEAAVPEPCLSACQTCAAACEACIADMSPENMAACVTACETCLNECNKLIGEPAYGAVCQACADTCKTCISLMGAAKDAEPRPDMVAMSEQLQAVKAENETLKLSIDALQHDNTVKFAELETKLSKHVELSALLNDAFIALAEVPAVAPTQAVKTETVQMSAQDLVQSQMRKIESYKISLNKTIKK